MKVFWINGVFISNLSLKWNKKILHIVYLDVWITIVVLLLLSNNGDPYIGFMFRYENNIWVSIFTACKCVHVCYHGVSCNISAFCFTHWVC